MRTESLMTVHLRQIPDAGLRLSYDLSGGWAAAALAGTEADAGTAALKADLFLQRSHPDVYVEGRIAGRVQVPCSRCTTPAWLDLDVPFQMTFVPRDSIETNEADEVELTDEDLDIATYAEDLIDLEETLREQLLLALPIAHLCKEECKGLCATCGKDLNEGPCTCPPAPKDDRWQALRNLKLT